jgi:hypothetical protein
VGAWASQLGRGARVLAPATHPYRPSPSSSEKKELELLNEDRQRIRKRRLNMEREVQLQRYTDIHKEVQRKDKLRFGESPHPFLTPFAPFSRHQLTTNATPSRTPRGGGGHPCSCVPEEPHGDGVVGRVGLGVREEEETAST